jgi:hypothetical protein
LTTVSDDDKLAMAAGSEKIMLVQMCAVFSVIKNTAITSDAMNPLNVLRRMLLRNIKSQYETAPKIAINVFFTRTSYYTKLTAELLSDLNNFLKAHTIVTTTNTKQEVKPTTSNKVDDNTPAGIEKKYINLKFKFKQTQIRKTLEYNKEQEIQYKGKERSNAFADLIKARKDEDAVEYNQFCDEMDKQKAEELEIVAKEEKARKDKEREERDKIDNENEQNLSEEDRIKEKEKRLKKLKKEQAEETDKFNKTKLNADEDRDELFNLMKARHRVRIEKLKQQKTNGVDSYFSVLTDTN